MTEQPSTRTFVPRHFIAGMVCAFVAFFALAIAIAYYILVDNGVFPQPPHGLAPILAAAIILLGVVPIGLWCAHVAAHPVHQRLDAVETRCVEEVAEMRKQHSAELAEVCEELQLLRQAVLNESEQASGVALATLEKHLNDRGANVAHLSRARPGS